MSICKTCGGIGKISGTFYRNGKYVSDTIVCKWCNGTGQVEQTNEEWIKSLDTEGLVDHLYEAHKGGASVERQAWIEKHKERIKMQIRGWLKEKHK